MYDIPAEAKAALQDGRQLKNYRINVLNDDGTVDFTIDNNTLVSESVKFDERMCSGDTIKFGLCEGSSLEFQYFDHQNIKGRRLQPFIDVDYQETVIDEEYETVAEMERFRTIIVPETSKYYVYANTENNFTCVWIDYNGSLTRVEPTNEDGKCFCEFRASAFSEIEVEFDHWGASTTYLQKVIETRHIVDEVCTIPMGYFTVKQCSRQASTGIIKVTAYNKLQSEYLDQKANQLLINSLDNPEDSYPIYSIEYQLLKDYELSPYSYSEEVSFGGLASNETMIVQKIHLSDLTSDDGPINYFNLVDEAARKGVLLTTSTDLYVTIVSNGVVWSLGPMSQDEEDKYYQFIQTQYNLSELIENFVRYLKYFFNACPLSKTGTEIIDGIKNQTMDLAGWRGLFGLYIRTTGLQGSLSYYNDYAYKYQNDGPNPVTGTVNDLLFNLLKLQYFTLNYIEAVLYVPYMMKVNILKNGTYESIGSFLLIGDSEIRYIGANDTIKYYPQFKYPDGRFIETSSPFRNWFKLYEVNNLTPADLVYIVPSTAADFTLRDIVSADFETSCQFGQLNRDTDLFYGIELNNQRLFPAEDLYPDNALFPGGAAMSSHRSMYSKLWGDEGNVQKWRYLIITFKGLDEEDKEKDFTLQMTVNSDGNVDYNMSDNWIFRNLVWTRVEVEEYATAMVSKMRNITWFPFEMWCPGLPYLETGDEIEVSIGNSTYSTYILQRQLKGIQNLQDTYINGTLDIF